VTGSRAKIGRVDEYTIESGDQCLAFRCTKRDAQGDAEAIEISFRDGGLNARVVADAGYVGFEDLAEFFSELGYSWQGWAGVIIYESLEHNVVLSAHHDGQVHLAVDLVPHDLRWHTHGELTIDPGDQLTAIVAGVSAVVGSRLNA